MSSATAWILILAAGVNSMIGNVLLKQSRLVAGGGSVLDQLRSPWFLGGLLFYGINVVLFAKALDRLPVSAAYPVLAACGFALLALVSALVFGERLSGVQYAGLVVTLGGIALIARG
ncbi:MAG: SMR family transporter [Candidatus Baltobacteraceae bacterium]